MHAKINVNFDVMQFTHVSGHNGAKSKKKYKSLFETVLLMGSQIKKENALVVLNVGYFN